MMRYLRRGLCAAAGFLALAGAPAWADDTSVTLTPVQVSEHVYYFGGEAGMASAANKGFMSNAGFVVTGDGVVVFDTLATPALGAAMLEAIGRITDQPVRRVIISHYHADHYYGLQEFKRAGAESWAHVNGQDVIGSPDALERLEQRRADLAPWVDADTVLTPADRWLDFAQGDTLSFTMGDLSFQVLDMHGAHSEGDIMLYVEDDKVLFAGDLYFTGRIPFVGDADSRAWLAAMDRMLDMKPDVVIPGHGRASTDTEQDMRLTRDYLRYLRQEMGRAVEDLTDFEQAYEDTDWSSFENYPAFQDANRINAYGQYLLMERESLAEQ